MNSNPTLIASTGQPVKCPSPGGAAKPIRNLSARLLLAAAFALSLASAQAADQFFAGDGSALTASKWGTSGGPYTDTFTNGNTANFGVVNGTGAGAGGISVGGLTATENFTYSSPSGTLLTGGAVVPVVVSAGKLLDLSTLGISTAAGVGFTKSGDGAFATAGNTYAGGFTLNAGSVILRGDNALGSGGSLTISSGAIGANATRNPSGKFPGGITISGNFQLGILSNAVSIASDTANITFNNNMALGAATRTITIGANGTYTLGGIIGGDSSAVGLTVNALGGATGSLKLTGVNTYLGLTTINGGTLYLGHASDTLDGDITVNGGTLNVDNPDTVGAVTLTSGLINGDSILTGTSYALESGTVSIVLAGSGAGLTKSTVGTVTNSAAWTYTGATAIQNGTLVLIGGNDRLPKTTAVTLGNGVDSGVLQLGDAGGARNQTLGSLTTSGSGTGNAVVGGNNSTSTLTVSNAAAASFAGVLGGTGANNNKLVLIKTGAGTLTLSGANTYTGATTVNDGTLQIDANDVIPDVSAVTIAKGALDINGRTETLGTSGTALTLGASSTSVLGNTAAVNDVATGGSLILGGNVTYNTGSASFNNGTATIAANLNLNGVTRTFNIGDSVQTTTDTVVSGQISNGALTKSGAGTLVLSGTNIHAGGTTISAGQLHLNNGGSGGTSSALGTGKLTISGGTIDNSSAGPVTLSTSNALALTGNFTFGGTQDLNLGVGLATLDSADRTITLNNDKTLTFGEFEFISGVSPRTLTANQGTGTGAKLVLGALRLNSEVNSPKERVINGNVNVDITGPVVNGNASANSLTYSGTKTLTLSGANTYTGNTKVNSGTLQISQAVIYTNSTVSVAAGAVLNLGFSVTNKVADFITNGVALPAGVYGAANVAPFIAGLGSLEVMVMGPSLPAVLTNSYSGGVLSLSWPAGQGWRLQMQTNSLDVGLATNWVQAADSSVSSTNIVTDSALPTVFYRLTYP
jgi:autotransporter-associated beta strand protein